MYVPWYTCGDQRTEVGVSSFLPCVGPRDWTQVIRLGGKHLYLLSFLPGPARFFFCAYAHPCIDWFSEAVSHVLRPPSHLVCSWGCLWIDPLVSDSQMLVSYLVATVAATAFQFLPPPSLLLFLLTKRKWDSFSPSEVRSLAEDIKPWFPSGCSWNTCRHLYDYICSFWLC